MVCTCPFAQSCAQLKKFQYMCLALYMGQVKVDCFTGIKESDTGLAAPSQWDLVSDKQMMQEEQPLQVWFGLIAHSTIQSLFCVII